MTKTDPLVTDEQIKGIRSNHDHALSVKASAYVIRDIYEADRALASSAYSRPAPAVAAAFSPRASGTICSIK